MNVFSYRCRLIEHDTINKINAGIIAIVGALTPATTKKIGL